jgi:NAD(P)-dependent dehydrogenase (short-subunit alcohol dehydrogenase family)
MATENASHGADRPLSGRRAFVSGSTLGIGYAIAQALARDGAQVTLNGRSAPGVAQAQARLRAMVPGADVQGVDADLGSAAGVAAALARLGAIDILVNNVGVFEPVPFEQIDDARWQAMFDVNVMSGVRLSRALLPGMLERNWGRIVFISSESGICPPAEMVHYGMSKSAQLSVSRGLAECCAGTGVTVNSVLPGPTFTEGAGAFFAALAQRSGLSLEQAKADFFAHARPTSIIRRFIEPDEVAALVSYVCSPLGAATTGAALRVDGGVVRSLV